MAAQWKIAALGALGGAVIAVAVVFGAAVLGLFPRQPLDGQKVRAYLLRHPQILAEMSNRLQEQEAAAEDRAERDRQAAVTKAGLRAFFDPAVAYVTGPATAKTTVVEFFDYNCVHCRNTFPVVQAFYESHKGDTRFAFIDFPIFGKMSTEAARAAIAARRQGDKYVAFSFAMMGEKGAIDTNTLFADAKAAGLDIAKLMADMKDPAVDKTIVAAHALAHQLNIDGTPTFIINGKIHSGEIEAATLDQMTRS
jgi:protein-disulfide isomerase